MENIKGLDEFLKVDFDYGYGAGSGAGFSCGYASGDGAGDSSGYGSSIGYGMGSGISSGNGSNNGVGYGSGYSIGYGYDNGSGGSKGYDYYTDGLLLFNNEKVFQIDYLPTIIKSIKGNVAKGFILNNDFTLDKCFVVKDGNLFAHGKTLREAMLSLNIKKWDNFNTDEVIAEFCKKFEKEKTYKGSEFFNWHHYLTGSCLQGREAFVKNHNLNLDDEFTVDEFIELTENDYGGKIIKQLKEVWDKNNIS